MKNNGIIKFSSLLIMLIAFSPVLMAEQTLTINYHANKDMLKLNLEDVYLDDVLKQLSDEIGFKLKLEGENLHRLISFGATGPSAVVIDKLVKPNSIIVSQSSDVPHKVISVTLLPTGQSSGHLANTAVDIMPAMDGDPETNKRRMKNYERRLKNHANGFGRRFGGDGPPPRQLTDNK